MNAWRSLWFVYFAISLVALLGCTQSINSMRDMSTMDIVAKNEQFVLVRLKPGQSSRDLAAVFLGHQREAWQIKEINANHDFHAGQLVAIPLSPLNSSSVYVDGYRTIPILCYHQFTPFPEASHRLEISASVFEQQLSYLKQKRFVFLSMEDLQAVFHGEKPVPPRAVVITIDDGYRSTYDVAWPILKRHEIPFTLFVYTDFIGAGSALNWQQIHEMEATGLAEVQSHAKSHTTLSQMPGETSSAAYEARVRSEIVGSRNAFSRNLGEAPRYFSYPYGNASIESIEILQDEGISLAATVTRGDNPAFAEPYLLHRTMIYGHHDLTEFKQIVRSFEDKALK